MLISLNKFKIINYITAGFILIAFLLVAREIINISLSVKKPASSVSLNQDVPVQQKNKKDIMHYSPLLERNPFGPPMKLHPIAIAKQQEVQYKSPSALVLVGTAVGPAHLSYAILEDKAQSPPKGHEVFARGEHVYNYGILKKIDRSSVELETDSSTFTIELEEDKAGAVQTQHTQKSRDDQSSFARQVGEKQYILDSRKVRKSLENPEKMLTDARLLPNIRDGRHEGFKISEVIPGGMYHSLGLRNGDILLKINGLEISNPEVAIKAMSALQGMNSVNLDIIRSNKNMSMNYKMR
jgi:general secretion pathway protein C